MKEININEFKKESFIEIIKELLKLNNGYVTSKLVTSLGIHRMYLKIMVEKGLLKKVGTGIYMSVDGKQDDYFIFSLDLENIIYSHFSALFLQGFSKNKSSKFYGTYDYFETVIDNILANFMRYTESTIKITAKNNRLTLYNDGPNIDDTLLEGIFTPFRKGIKGEFGLGLSIVKKTLLLMNYDITVKNEKKGVSFVIFKKTSK